MPSSGNHHLVSIIVVLTAVLLMLTTYTILYASRSRHKAPSTSATQSNARQVRDGLPDTPTGLTSFVGTIAAVRGNEVTVRMGFVKNGEPGARNISVNLASGTAIMKHSTAAAAATNGGKTEVQNVDRSVLKLGVLVLVKSREVIDGRSAVTADSIEVNS